MLGSTRSLAILKKSRKAEETAPNPPPPKNCAAAVSFEDPLVNRTRPLSLLHSIIVRTKSNVFISVSRETKAAQALRDPRVRGGRPVDPVPSVRWDLKALQA